MECEKLIWKLNIWKIAYAKKIICKSNLNFCSLLNLSPTAYKLFDVHMRIEFCPLGQSQITKMWKGTEHGQLWAMVRHWNSNNNYNNNDNIVLMWGLHIWPLVLCLVPCVYFLDKWEPVLLFSSLGIHHCIMLLDQDCITVSRYERFKQLDLQCNNRYSVLICTSASIILRPS